MFTPAINKKKFVRRHIYIEAVLFEKVMELSIKEKLSRSKIICKFLKKGFGESNGWLQ